ncbi:hypothetical protein J2S53_001099 [Actinopolyspora lacussalsi]|nr:hypothetical protein [Actinopolyspora lacussalsi]
MCRSDLTRIRCGSEAGTRSARVSLGRSTTARRDPGLALDVDRAELVVEQVPLLVRYRELPVRLGG